jgi:hypothetical protein
MPSAVAALLLHAPCLLHNAELSSLCHQGPQQLPGHRRAAAAQLRLGPLLLLCVALVLLLFALSPLLVATVSASSSSAVDAAADARSIAVAGGGMGFKGSSPLP